MTCSPSHDIMHELNTQKLVGILRHNSGEHLAKVAEKLYESGVGIIEVTFTVPQAAQVIATINHRLGKKIILGAGTILDPETAQTAIDAGARFLVAPNTNVELIQYGRRHSTPLIPGALTPTEICHAYEAGAQAVKVFPSDTFGPSYITAIRRPLPHIPLIPTGGIDASNLLDYLKAGVWAVGIGSPLVQTKWVDEQNFEAIAQAAAKLVAIVKDFMSDKAN